MSDQLIASRHRAVGIPQRRQDHPGAVCRHGLAGKWWAAVPPEQWPQDPQSRAFIDRQRDDAVGDARQELVLIGIEMDPPGLRARLQACLLSDAEMAQGPAGWLRMADPFPLW